MKHLLFFLLFTSSVFALNINESLLSIHATLVPKIPLMDYEYDKKIKDNSIVVALLYENINYKNALLLKKMIDEKYTKGIKSYNIITKLVSYKNLNKTDANIYYLFPTNNKKIKRTIDRANKNHALTFSYLKEDLQYGVMISLNIDDKIKPVLNIDAIKMYNIVFRPVLLDISLIYKIQGKNLLQYHNLRGFNTSSIFIAFAKFLDINRV
jgi:hypothetical protein